MTIINLNLSLTQERSNRQKTKEDLESRFFSEGAVKSSYSDKTVTYTEELIHNYIPDADIYHNNYLEYLQTCYANHYGYVIAPHTFWYSIVAEIAQYVVTHPESYRSVFTDSAEKKEIMIPCGGFDEPLRIYDIYDKLVTLVPIDTSIFLPEFSTTTIESKAATLGAFLETASPYYSYIMYACGFPKVRFDGTEEDWIKMTTNIQKLTELFLPFKDQTITRYLIKVFRFVADVAQAAAAKNINFFNTIFTQKRCGSGSQHFVNGLYPNAMYIELPKQLEVCNFSQHITKVPYTISARGMQQRYKMIFALSHSNIDPDGIAVPQFGSAVIKLLDKPLVKPWLTTIRTINIS